MTWLDAGLSDFGSSLGMHKLIWPQSGAAVLNFEQFGNLAFERGQQFIRLTLTRKHDYFSSKQLQAALQLCHWQNRTVFPLRAALIRPSELLFELRIPHADFVISTIQQAFDCLCQAHAEIDAIGL